MLSLNELADLRMQQQIAHEIYRQQIIQRIPDPYPQLLHIPIPHHVIVPPRPTLPGTVKATLENNDLWQQFHEIGTEMIITKSGRRMFPSMRVSFCGLEEETNYCVLLEMIPIGDCRYKFSGSQWVPAGGAEPQSPQRMFLHPDSPATGTHWQSQPILFNKVKLTNNTLDSSGHIVLASMHKYQPRLHIIRSSDLTHLPWAPQQAFVFPETEFVAVTAYQNDRITKLKIDNNPFAKGFRETGQSRCKRKLNTTSNEQPHDSVNNVDTLHNLNSSSKSCVNNIDDDRSSISSSEISQLKRLRSTGSIDDNYCFSSSISSGSISPHLEDMTYQHMSSTLYQHHPAHMMGALPMDMLPATCMAVMPMSTHISSKIFLDSYSSALPQESHSYLQNEPPLTNDVRNPQLCNKTIESTFSASISSLPSSPSPSNTTPKIVPTQTTQSKRNGFSISAILAY